MNEQKQKILYVITKGNWGGAQKYVYDLATRLAHSHEVSVAIGVEGDILAQKLSARRIRVHILLNATRDMGVWSSIKFFFDFLNLLKKETPDVVHLNSPQVGGLGALAARIYNGVQRIKKLLTTRYSLPTKIIFTSHGWAWNEDRNFLARVIIWFLSWLTVLLSHKTIAVSKSIMRDARMFPFVKRKMVMIQSGIESPAFFSREEARRAFRERIGTPIPENTAWIGTIAELHPSKGVSFAIDAMESIPGATYIIIGNGEERGRLENLVRTKGLTERVFFAGHIDDAARFLPAFDIFLFPSITEALGYALLEAGFAGLPSVATHVGGIPEIIKNGETGILVPPKNPRAIADALLILIQDKKRAEAYGAFLSADVKKRFSVERMVQETMAVYEKIQTAKLPQKR